MKTHKFLSILLAVITMMSAITAIPHVYAKEKVYKEKCKTGLLYYKLDKKGNADIVDIGYVKGDYLKIPSKLSGHKVTRFSTAINGLKKIKFPKTVKYITPDFAKSMLKFAWSFGFFMEDMETLVVTEGSYAQKYAVKHQLMYISSGQYKGNLQMLSYEAGSIKAKLKISDTNGNFLKKKYYYTGSPIKPKELKIKVQGKKLKEGKDYKLSYTENIRVGCGQIFINGRGVYSGTCNIRFEILPKKDKIVKYEGETENTVKISTDPGNKYDYPYTGREFQISENQDFSNYSSYITDIEQIYSVTVNNLEPNKTYFVRERPFDYPIYGLISAKNENFLSDKSYNIYYYKNTKVYAPWSDTLKMKL